MLDVFRHAPSRGGRGRRFAVDIVVCLGRRDFFRVFYFYFVFLRTHKAYCKNEATSCLIYTSTSTGVVVAVAGLLWISWCVFGGANFLVCFFQFCFSTNARDLLLM